MSQLKRNRETGIIERFMDLFELGDMRVKTLALTSDIPVMYLADIDTPEGRVKYLVNNTNTELDWGFQKNKQ